MSDLEDALRRYGTNPSRGSWATEETLRQVLSAIKGISGGNRSSSSSKSYDARLLQSQKKREDSDESAAKASSILSKQLGSASNAADKVTNFYNGTMSRLNGTLVGLVGGSGGALGAFAGRLDDATKSYRTMITNGQMFGGSMLDMKDAAARANMSLDDFVEYTAQFSELSKQMDLGTAQKEVRRAMMDVGAFGMTTRKVSETYAEYLDTYRQVGQAENMDRTLAASSFKELIGQVTAYSNMTGKNRDKVIQESLQTVKDSKAARLALLALPQESTDAFNQITAQITNIGDSDVTKPLMDIINSSIAGNVGFSAEQMNMFNKAGIGPELITKLQEGSDLVKTGGKVDPRWGAELQDILKKSIKTANISALNAQASSGDELAKSVRDMILSAAQTRGGTEQFDKSKQEVDKGYNPAANAALNVGESASQARGAVEQMAVKAEKATAKLIELTGSFDLLNNTMIKVGQHDLNADIDNMSNTVESFSQNVGQMIKDFDLSNIMGNFDGLGEKLGDFSGIVGNFISEHKGSIGAAALAAGGMGLMSFSHSKKEGIWEGIKGLFGGGDGGNNNPFSLPNGANFDLNGSDVTMSGGDGGGWMKTIATALLGAGAGYLIAKSTSKPDYADNFGGKAQGPNIPIEKSEEQKQIEKDNKDFQINMVDKLETIIDILVNVAGSSEMNNTTNTDSTRYLRELVNIQDQIRKNTI